MTNLQSVPEQQHKREIANFAKFPKKTKRPESSDSQPREDLKSQNRERSLPPQPIPIHKPSMTSMIWNIPIHQLGLAAGLRALPAPVHSPITGKTP